MFDPYHRWLAIPKGDRPPTYYQLLGIAPDEADVEVIAEAALRQAGHVRTYQTGAHAEQCTALLNEIAQARTTLLHPGRRKDYDAKQGRAGAPPNRAPTEASEGPPGGEVLAASPFAFEGQAGEPAERSASSARSRGTSWADPAALAYAALLLLGGALAFWLGSAPPQHAAPTREPHRDTPATKTKPASPRAPANRD